MIISAITCKGKFSIQIKRYEEDKNKIPEVYLMPLEKSTLYDLAYEIFETCYSNKRNSFMIDGYSIFTVRNGEKIFRFFMSTDPQSINEMLREIVKQIPEEILCEMAKETII